MQPPDTARRHAETRRLQVLLGALALLTAALGLRLYPTLNFATLLLPFTVFAASCGLVLPLDGFDRHKAQATARLEAGRRREADRHAMPASRTSGFYTSAAEARAEVFAHQQRAMAAAEAHGIHFASAALTDEEFHRRFIAGELRAGEFRHGDHLRFAWLTLERLPLGMAEETIAGALRAFLRRISGSNAQFHATHTHGWVAVLASLPQRSFAEALTANMDALSPTALTRFWTEAVLDSPAARAAAPPPDVSSLPVPAARRTRRYRAGNTSLPPAPYAPVIPAAQRDV